MAYRTAVYLVQDNLTCMAYRNNILQSFVLQVFRPFNQVQFFRMTMPDCTGPG